MTQPVPFKSDVHTDVFPAMLVISPAGAPAASIYTQPRELATYGAKRVEGVRVLVTSTHVLVYDEGIDGNGPRIVYSQPIVDFARAKTRSSRLNDATRSMHPEATGTTIEGSTFAFYRSAGCGCGSRLKSFNPFNSLRQFASING